MQKIWRHFNEEEILQSDGAKNFGNIIRVFVYKADVTFTLKSGSLKNLGVIGQGWLQRTKDITLRFIVSMQQIDKRLIISSRMY